MNGKCRKSDLMEKVIVVVGPTAVGKTKTSIEIAKKFNGEIINGDSTQVYRDLNIGTAKITEAEMDGITHHLIDMKNPDESFSVAEFQGLVREKIHEINEAGKTPIIVGGTGLYIQSVLYDYEFSEASSNDKLRMELENFAKEHGNEALHHKLKEIDIKSAETIHPNNVRRVIRAIEVFEESGVPFSEYLEKQKRELLYDATMIGLTMERDVLYDRINYRVEKMMEEGLLEEVRSLYDRGYRDCQALHAIGYRELYDYLEGRLRMEQAIEAIQQNTRRYAKRQFTWFRNKMDITWFDMTSEDKIQQILQYLEEKLEGKSNIL